MKNEVQIHKKLKEAKQRYLKGKYQDRLTCKPENCVHNYRHKTKDAEGNDTEVGLCMLGSDNPEEWAGSVCDTVPRAKKCPFYEGKHTKEGIQQELEDELKDDAIVANNYKDIAALQWAVDDRVWSWEYTFGERIKFMFFYTLYKYFHTFYRLF